MSADKDFEEWWKAQEGVSSADPKEMLDAMIEAFRDVAQMAYLASRKAALEEAAKVCFTAREQVIAAIVDLHMRDEDEKAEQLRPVMGAILDVHTAILALIDKP